MLDPLLVLGIFTTITSYFKSIYNITRVYSDWQIADHKIRDESLIVMVHSLKVLTTKVWRFWAQKFEGFFDDKSSKFKGLGLKLNGLECKGFKLNGRVYVRLRSELWQFRV